MFLIFSICVLFALYAILVFFEDSIEATHRKVIYWVTCVLLIFLAATREVGIDPDSEVYQANYQNPYSNNLLDAMEFSFVLISQILNYVTNDVHALFFVYALLGVMLKFLAFRHYSDSWLLIVFMYIGFYYELHETCQIRAGVLSGCMLMAVPCIVEGKRLIAFLWIVAGSCFHISGLILLPLLFLGNEPLNLYWKVGLALSIPIAYIFAGLNLGLEFASELPYIGNKLSMYQEAEEKGKVVVSSLKLYSPQHLLTVLVFYYLLFWADAITAKSRYFPIMLKIFAVALVSYALFSFIPVMGERMGSMYRTIITVLFPAIVYTLKPKWCGVLLFVLVAFMFFNFSLRNMYNVAFIVSTTK